MCFAGNGLPVASDLAEEVREQHAVVPVQLPVFDAAPRRVARARPSSVAARHRVELLLARLAAHAFERDVGRAAGGPDEHGVTHDAVLADRQRRRIDVEPVRRRGARLEAEKVLVPGIGGKLRLDLLPRFFLLVEFRIGQAPRRRGCGDARQDERASEERAHREPGPH